MARFQADNGHTVTTVSTADRGQWFKVTDPFGCTVPLDPWNPQHNGQIRTIEQLRAVLGRQGEDIGTLRELHRG